MRGKSSMVTPVSGLREGSESGGRGRWQDGSKRRVSGGKFRTDNLGFVVFKKRQSDRGEGREKEFIVEKVMEEVSARTS